MGAPTLPRRCLRGGDALSPAAPPVLAHVACYVPADTLPVEQLVERLRPDKMPKAFATRDDYLRFIREVLALAAVRVEPRLSDREMLATVVEELFAGGVDPDEIGLILLAQEPDQLQHENLGQYVQFEFALDRAYVVNVGGNHCANIEHALALGKTLLAGDPGLDSILVLGSVKLDQVDERIVGTYGLLADGAGAAVLRRDGPGVRLLDQRVLCNGRFHDVDLDRDDSLLHFKYYVRCMQELLERSGTAPGEVAHVLTQNANTLLFSQCLSAVGVDTERIFRDNLTRYGHLDCLDFLVNLKDLLARHDPGPGERILSFGTGWAGTYIATLWGTDGP